jgi:hypothetical protein
LCESKIFVSNNEKRCLVRSAPYQFTPVLMDREHAVLRHGLLSCLQNHCKSAALCRKCFGGAEAARQRSGVRVRLTGTAVSCRLGQSAPASRVKPWPGAASADMMRVPGLSAYIGRALVKRPGSLQGLTRPVRLKLVGQTKPNCRPVRRPGRPGRSRRARLTRSHRWGRAH